MTAFSTAAFLQALPWSAGALLVVLAATFIFARLVGRHSVIDTAWGLLFVAVAIAVTVRSDGHGNDVRRTLLVALPAVWGLRLAFHIGRRTIGTPEDPRYIALLAKAKGNRDLYALRSIYLLQGLLAFLISAPIQVGVFEVTAMGPFGWVGVAVWSLGVFFEATGDYQLERFRDDPANKGKIMNVGLWRYTRHPNYFGDACVWWGIFLVAAQSWAGLATIFAPIGMTLLLTKGSGARILDRHMSARPGWTEYAATTSSFFPRPPKRRPRLRDESNAAPMHNFPEEH